MGDGLTRRDAFPDISSFVNREGTIFIVSYGTSSTSTLS